ncbi:hypothetical protein [Listeria grayi]|uniref:hypothetical protein n=1 Tax=Listeria grayi TaxID=1641 RepID=UPI0011EA57C3|nr:hypothetical protein [Listeria grayi]
MNRILIAISLIINFIFMMLTTLLPILVFNITRSTTDVGGVLTVFMISLLLVRIISLKRYMDPVLAVVAGCILFFLRVFIAILLPKKFNCFLWRKYTIWGFNWSSSTSYSYIAY